MSKYDNEYFFILKNESNPRLPSLKADVNTAQRRYDVEPPGIGSAPFVFSNAWRDENLRNGVKDDIADILFEGANFMVRDSIRERLLPEDLPGVTIHPSIYIDDAGNWHEDFWFLTFHSELDCWDRDRSSFMAGTSTRDMVFKYFLDANVLDAIPLQQRLLFQMGGGSGVTCVVSSVTCCNISTKRRRRRNAESGARLSIKRNEN